MNDGDSPLWTRPAWLEEAGGWIAAELRRLGLVQIGPVEQPHVRPWSTVLRIPTEAGDVWFKASMPALAHEAGVVEVLARRRPDCLPGVLARDAERGWMLQADGGVRLREVLGGRQEPRRWETFLELYAGLQIDAAADRDDLLAAGAPDRTLAALPALYEDLLERQETLEPDELGRLRARAPRVAELCEELAAYGLPETIQHDDLHSGNVLLCDGAYVFFDWGDACVSHPFLSLHVTLRVLAHELRLPPRTSQLDRYADAYLEPWTRFLPLHELRTALAPADVLGGISRALSWQLVAEATPPGERAEYVEDVVDRLRTFLASSEG